MGCAPANPGHCTGREQPSTEQHPQREARLAVLQRWPSSTTSLSISLNPFNNMLKKKGKTKFLLPCKQSPHASPTSALGLLRATMPAPCKSRDDAPRPPMRAAWAFKPYIARRHQHQPVNLDANLF